MKKADKKAEWYTGKDMLNVIKQYGVNLFRYENHNKVKPMASKRYLIEFNNDNRGIVKYAIVKQEKTTASYSTVVKRYNKVIEQVGAEHMAIDGNYREDCGQDDFTINDMVHEVWYWLDFFGDDMPKSAQRAGKGFLHRFGDQTYNDEL